MIYNYSEGPIDQDEQKVRIYLEEKNFQRVIDLGGVQRPWARPYVTHYVDLITPEKWAERYPEMKEYGGFWNRKFIQGDLDSAETWQRLYKYDFAICTQMIEHSRDPEKLLNRISTIAKQGFISVPHHMYELRKGIHWDHNFRGALPHRWIIIIRDSVMWFYPKLCFIESMKFDFVDNYERKIPDLSFWWKDEIPVKIIDDSHLDFPDPQIAKDFYAKEMRR